LLLDAGHDIRVQAAPGGPVTVSRIALNMPDQRHQVSTRLDDVIRRVVELGGTYPDVVQMLQHAASCGVLAGCRLEVDAVPQAGRSLARAEGAKKGEESSSFTVRNPLPNLFPGSNNTSPSERRRDLTGRTKSKTEPSEWEKLWERVSNPWFLR
jgi:hypothetical protein